jgi:DNA-binding response OmpR family regulator
MLSLLSKTRLLVLDDDPAMQRLVGTILRRAGYRVDVVSEASQAIEKIGRYDYDALLLDIMTPTEGGMTVIRHLKTAKPALLKRVLLVTGSPDAVLKNVTGDVYGVVRKPFESKDLVTTIGKLVGK